MSRRAQRRLTSTTVSCGMSRATGRPTMTTAIIVGPFHAAAPKRHPAGGGQWSWWARTNAFAAANDTGRISGAQSRTRPPAPVSATRRSFAGDPSPPGGPDPRPSRSGTPSHRAVSRASARSSDPSPRHAHSCMPSQQASIMNSWPHASATSARGHSSDPQKGHASRPFAPPPPPSRPSTAAPSKTLSRMPSRRPGRHRGQERAAWSGVRGANHRTGRRTSTAPAPAGRIRRRRRPGRTSAAARAGRSHASRARARRPGPQPAIPRAVTLFRRHHVGHRPPPLPGGAAARADANGGDAGRGESPLHDGAPSSEADDDSDSGFAEAVQAGRVAVVPTSPYRGICERGLGDVFVLRPPFVCRWLLLIPPGRVRHDLPHAG